MLKSSPTLDAKLVNAISSATMETLRTMANTEASLKEVVANNKYTPQGDVSAIIGITGEGGEGMISLSFTYNQASAIVARLLGVKPEMLSAEDRCDGIGELVNMISGNAKTALSAEGNSPYKMSLPTIILGQKHEVSASPKGVPYLLMAFETDESEFHLQVTFKFQ